MKLQQLISLITLSGPASVIASSALLVLALSGAFVAVYATVWGAQRPPAVRNYLLALVSALWGRK